MRIFIHSVAVLFGALAFAVAGAGANVIEQQDYSDVDSFTLNDCGFVLEGVAETSGHLLFRVDRTGQVFLAKDTYSFRTTLTNPATGRAFFLRGQGVYHEIAATPLGGTLYEVVAIEAGVPFTIVDSTGRVVLRDRGAIRITYLFDSYGDGTPGGETVDVVDVVVHGPHPSFDTDFCQLAAELTGAA
jgi:hypothetical protein